MVGEIHSPTRTTMRLGVHIRISQGLLKALEQAHEIGCETVQLFSGNPNGWARTKLDPEVAARFRARTAELDIHPVILHTPYLLNLASPSDDTWCKSIGALSDAVNRAVELNADYIVTHIGSHKGEGYEEGVRRICEAVKQALETADGPTIALELGSGAGYSIGSTFEQIADIFEFLHDQERVGICIDTAHLWGAGYDISTDEGVDATLGQLDRVVGAEYLKVVHLNDTLKDLGSHGDRHYHIGQGQIGSAGFEAILRHPITRDLPGIIETPGETIEFDRGNLGVLRGLMV